MRPKLRMDILHRDAFTCRYCGRSAPHVELAVDHVVSRADGGTDDPANLVTACVECNAGKGRRSFGTVAFSAAEMQDARVTAWSLHRRAAWSPVPAHRIRDLIEAQSALRIVMQETFDADKPPSRLTFAPGQAIP